MELSEVQKIKIQVFDINISSNLTYLIIYLSNK